VFVPHRIRGLGFVEMSIEEEAAAIDVLNGAEWMGGALKVKKVTSKVV